MSKTISTVIISVGSNLPDSKRIVEECCLRIKPVVSTSKFSLCYETVPVSTIPQANYHNCVGVITTDKTYDELRTLFKAMEVDAGREKQDKLRGVVALDIDIVKWNDNVMYPRDYIQDYMQIGLKQLRIK